jgi:hypothetical protein
MSFFPKSQYPAPKQSLPEVAAQVNGPALSPRAIRIIHSLACLAGIVVILYFTWRMVDAIKHPTPPPPVKPPLDFDLVEKRYKQVGWKSSQGEVEELLGPHPPCTPMSRSLRKSI